MGGYERAGGQCGEGLKEQCVERHGEQRMAVRYVESLSASTGLQQALEA